MTDRAVVVTGASRGIGRATALAFAAAGDRVVVNHRDSQAEAEQLLRLMPGSGHLAIKADLADPDAAQDLVEAAVAALGRLDVLVNNAGISLLHDIAVDDFATWRAAWDRTLAVNLSGPAFVTYWAGSADAPPGRRQDHKHQLSGGFSRRAGTACLRSQQGWSQRLRPVTGAGARWPRNRSDDDRARLGCD